MTGVFTMADLKRQISSKSEDCIERTSTKQYYKVHALDYFRATFNLDIHTLWEKFELHVVSGAKVIDIGCGSGRDLVHFANHGYKVVGVDYSIELLKLAGAHSHQPVVLAEIASLPFKANTFDAGWAIGSLLHIPRNSINDVLAGIYKILKQDSILLTSVKKGLGDQVDHLGRYTAFYDLSEWRDLVEDSGFAIVEIEEENEKRAIKLSNRETVSWINCLARKI
jgi:SAM-dependent methyltransferase